MENTINDIDGIVNYQCLIFFYMQIILKTVPSNHCSFVLQNFALNRDSWNLL